MNYYRVLDIVPDFASPTGGGVYVPRSDTAIAAGEIFSRWPGRNARTQSFQFELRGPSEVKALREFISAVRGPWEPFFCPSWTRDFGAQGEVDAGTNEMVIDVDPAAWTAADRPDTFGRTIYVYTAARQLHVARIRTTDDNGDGTWTVELDRPFPWDADLGRCLTGVAWFVHCAGGDYEWNHLTPDRAAIELAVIEGRNTRVQSGEHEIAVVEIYDSEPFDTLVETSADPWTTDPRFSQCLGPDEFNEAQDLNFNNGWSFTLHDGEVTIASGTETETSALFDGDDTVEMISGAFDALGKEALAWQDDFETIRLRWYQAGTPSSIAIPGRTPVLFQNWTMNGAISAGDGDVVAYYVRPGESKLFARYQRDAFATEYEAAVLPIAPLALLGNSLEGQNHVVRAISAHHTRLEIVSEPYLLPPPRVTDAATGTEALVAEVNLMVMDASALEDAESDGGAQATETVGGAVNFMVVDREAQDDSQAQGSETVTGVLNFMVVDAEGNEDEILTDESLSGAYNQIAVDGEGGDAATATEITTGTYGLP
jgi:hypothetical protein